MRSHNPNPVRASVLTPRGHYSAQKRTTYVQTHAYSASHNQVAKSRTHLISQPSLVPHAPNETNFALQYTYESGRPHLPSRIGDLLVTYDPSGNPITRASANNNSVQTLVWDDDGRMIEYQGGGVNQQNTYDASGLRVRRKSNQGETVFASMYFDVENGTQGTRHVFAGDMRVASELGKFSGGTNPAAPSKPGTAYFFHGDHLGSTTVLTNDAGAVHQSLEYFPDGEAWIDRGPQKPVNRYLFTGKPFDSDTGLYDFGQRFYDPRTSLWLGVDPAFTADPAKSRSHPEMLGLFSYGNNNPIRFVDPDGREVVENSTAVSPNRFNPKATKRACGNKSECYVRAIARQAVVKAALKKAWTESNPDAANVTVSERYGSPKKEQGGWILWNPKDNKLSIQRHSADSRPGDARKGMNRDAVPAPTDTAVVIAGFHTHPNTREEGAAIGPSKPDINNVNNVWKVPEIIRDHEGIKVIPYP